MINILGKWVLGFVGRLVFKGECLFSSSHWCTGSTFGDLRFKECPGPFEIRIALKNEKDHVKNQYW